jgi:hypothetical protein
MQNQIGESWVLFTVVSCVTSICNKVVADEILQYNISWTSAKISSREISLHS